MAVAPVKLTCLLGVILLVTLSEAFPSVKDLLEDKPKCGYGSCPTPDPNMINVHIVPHTHDDVGWLKTFDQYYYGSRQYIQKAGVQYILDSVVSSLLQDPKKKFIYVESAFFFKWWDEQTKELQEQVKMLVQEGRLEFIGGAWSMNDEATTHYQSIIDQFTWGLRRLNDTFGECGRPKIGWQIDPFGHAQEQASMFSQMAYDGLFLGRIHYKDKDRRLQQKQMEMVWRASQSLGEDIFTGVLYNLYQGPSGSCWDVMCSDEPFIDDNESMDNNVERLTQYFLSHFERQSRYYRTNNIMITMGGDFHYQDANYYYKNLDKLIKYTNERQQLGSKFNLFYSTPSCYLKSLQEANQTWPVKTGDFFPYVSESTAVWTGYFTSRPTVKRYERMGNHFLQVCKQLTSLGLLKGSIKKGEEQGFMDRLTKLRQEMGVMQHHDAVTGTEKQPVANDYIYRMYRALEGCNENAKEVLNDLMGVKKKVNAFEFESCHFLNISKCDVSERNQRFMVTAYNPLSHSTSQPVRVPVPHTNYRVFDHEKNPMEIQLVPVNDRVIEMHYRESRAEYEIVFMASKVPALGYRSYYVEEVMPPKGRSDSEEIWEDPETKKVTIGNENIKAIFSARSGFLTQVVVNGEVHKVSQEFVYYNAAPGHNYGPAYRASGAYIFRPNGSEVLTSGEAVSIQVVRGEMVDEVYQRFNNWISQVVRIYHDNSSHVEFEWTVGPIPIEEHYPVGKEIVSRFSSIIRNHGEFYTDSQGREMIKRERNEVPLFREEIIAQNYYPLNSRIYVEDENSRMTLFTDRSQGASSPMDGSVDIMVHRRLLYDDAFGVGEALNEVQHGEGLIASGKMQMVFSSKKTQDNGQERLLENRILLPNWLFFSPVNESLDEWHQKYKNMGSNLQLDLPKNVYLMTMEPWKRENQLLLRFENLLEKGQEETFDLQSVFGDLFTIEDMRETNLSGNQWLENVKRMKFRTEGDLLKNDHSETSFSSTNTDKSNNFTITLKPLQIRTFVVSATTKN